MPVVRNVSSLSIEKEGSRGKYSRPLHDLQKIGWCSCALSMLLNKKRFYDMTFIFRDCHKSELLIVKMSGVHATTM
jgi:hypothetical protein